MRRRKGEAATDPALAKRIAMLAPEDFAPWVEQCLFTVGSSMTAYGRQRRPELLDEALNAARVAVELLEEMKRRLVV